MAEEKLEQAIKARGEACPAGFPDTVYCLPIIYSFLGHRVSTLGDMKPVIDECRRLLPPVPEEKVWLPYLGNALDAGAATLFAEEIIEACKYAVGPDPVNGIWLGAASDLMIRERGIEFVDGTAPGFATVVGAAPDTETAVAIARELQERMLYVFIAGNTDGLSFAEQLGEAGVQLGWDTRLVPFGKEITAAVYALGFANRVALSFGGVEPGDFNSNLLYNKDRVFAFVMTLGEIDDFEYATGAGAINYGFPVVADSDIPEILPTGICTYEHVVSRVPHDKIVDRALEVRGCKVRVTRIPVPVACAAAFGGERIRKGEYHAEFGGNRTPAFEFLTSGEMDEIEDGKMALVGPDIDSIAPEAEDKALPLGIWVEAAGRKMQPDFEPVLERQIHHFINSAENVWHVGQRDIVWLRIGNKAYEKGFRVKHLGEIIRARLLADYPAIVDKVQVTLITDPSLIPERLQAARETYLERNRRLASLTDESVDTFYSCTLCQSFAPNHVCVISPERLGLCGAYSWLDGKAAYEIDPTGPNRPIQKGELSDPVNGQWKGINEAVYNASRQTIEKMSLYSLMEDPMTSCGCFEAIVAIVPECNGVMIVNREYTGQTPCGMTFPELAGTISGGVQVEGFMGIGKAYISSGKFISANGGVRRIVWMPRELKSQVEADFKAICRELAVPDLMDRIADESVTVDPMELAEFLAENGHCALEMEPMF